MIVDLMRNDLGRVSEYGSVRHRAARRRGTPRPLASGHATCAAGCAAASATATLLRATFPPGSVTGAPKVQAMRVISELESTGARCTPGAIGFASPIAGLELNVAIRTFELRDGRAWLGGGGGIVADSDPARARGGAGEGAAAGRRRSGSSVAAVSEAPAAASSRPLAAQSG